MKLLTRIKISYFLAFICPVVLILATVFGVMKMGLNSMEQKYDLDQSSYEMILDPMSMLGHMTASTVEELETGDFYFSQDERDSEAEQIEQDCHQEAIPQSLDVSF